MITYKDARALFFYNSKAGALRWKTLKCYKGRKKAGPLGSLDGKGYLSIHIRPHIYRVHRVIWMWKTGEWPRGEIDHKNGIRTDNRWSNLRIATRLQQCFNQKVRGRSNRSGLKGVHWRKDLKSYAAVIHVGNKKIYLGFDKNPERAGALYRKAAKKYFGEFARTS